MNAMIDDSAKEFVDLRTSERPDEYRERGKVLPLRCGLKLLGNTPRCKEWVAQNKTVPTEVQQLATDVNPRIRVAVAMKNKLSKDLMLMLAKDSDSSVRERIAYNKNASDEVLRLLAQDTVVSVSEAARNSFRFVGHRLSAASNGVNNCVRVNHPRSGNNQIINT